MTIHEFGKKDAPVLLLLPGTVCYWKGNFGHVIEDLAEDFRVAAVAYTGFDESDTEDYSSVMKETEKIERYIQANYGGEILAAYGCSLGGTFVAHLTARHNIRLKYGIIGSSDMDQMNGLAAALLSTLIVSVVYHFIHTGSYRTGFMRKRFEKEMSDPDPYNRQFVAMTGRDRYDLSFISKKSIRNQFRSDLVTPLPEQINNVETEIHVFYAKKMGEKYLSRYRRYFRDPVIHEQDLRHEELLAVYPGKWCALVKEICLGKKEE